LYRFLIVSVGFCSVDVVVYGQRGGVGLQCFDCRWGVNLIDVDQGGRSIPGHMIDYWVKIFDGISWGAARVGMRARGSGWLPLTEKIYLPDRLIFWSQWSLLFRASSKVDATHEKSLPTGVR